VHTRVLGHGLVVASHIKEVVKVNHCFAHVVHPFEDLWLDIDQEGIR
jgi:hypothetical protein